MLVEIGNRITITDITPALKRFIKNELTFANPQYLKKQRMSLSTYGVPKQILLYETNEGKYIIPYGMLRKILLYIRDAEKRVDFPTMRKIDYNANFKLYDYQKKAVEQMKAYYYGILKAPAGSGKTQMGLSLITQIGGKALWLTHTKDLLEQSYCRAKDYIDESLLGKISDGKVNIGKGITFATVQTMEKLDLPLYRNEFDIIIVDECHRVCVSSTSTTMFAKVLNNLSCKYKYGLSATTHRADGLIACTYAILGNVMYEVPEEEVSDKIMRVEVQPIYTGIKLGEEALNYDGTIDYNKMINFLSNSKKRNEIILNTLVTDFGKPTLVLASRVEHLNYLYEMLPVEIKNKACVVNGKMTSKIDKNLRNEYINQMRKKEKSILFATYNLAKEGLDIPCLERLILATPQKDYAVIVQSIGRIARTCEGKQQPIAYDLVDNDRYLYKCFKTRCGIYNKINVKLKED